MSLDTIRIGWQNLHWNRQRLAHYWISVVSDKVTYFSIRQSKKKTVNWRENPESLKIVLVPQKLQKLQLQKVWTLKALLSSMSSSKGNRMSSVIRQKVRKLAKLPCEDYWGKKSNFWKLYFRQVKGNAAFFGGTSFSRVWHDSWVNERPPACYK